MNPTQTKQVVLRPAAQRGAAHGAAGSLPRSRRLLFSLAVVTALVGAVWFARWAWLHRVNVWIIEQGREIIQVDAALDEQSFSVDRWVQRTRASWPANLDGLIEALYAAGPAESPQVRAMLERLARVNYADRARDWQRWYEGRGGGLFGDIAPVPAKERVTLQQAWQAPVGLTGWFSTPLALDGKIYIPSLGRALNDPSDLDDGVVIVDGATGAAHLIPELQTKGSRDVLGLSAGNERIFAVQLNGYVSAMSLDGVQQWLTNAGDLAAGAPLSCDVDKNGVIDVIVPLKNGRTAALHGATGKVLWRGKQLGGSDAIGAVLSIGRGGIVWLTTPEGHIAALDPRTGAVSFQHQIAGGTLSGVLSQGGTKNEMRWLADRQGRLWSVAQHSPNRFSVVPAGPPAGEGLSLVAAARTLRRSGDAAPLVLLCPTSDYLEGHSSAWALSLSGTHWRVPAGGAVLATPVIANLNQALGSEIILATIVRGEQELPRGALQVFSSSGHLLWSLSLKAAVETTPLIADVDGDQKLELLVIDQSGTMTCFKTRSTGPVEWGSFGGDPHNTRDEQNAYSFGQRPFGMQWQWRPEAVIKG